MMSFSRPIQCSHSHADPVWPEGPLNILFGGTDRIRIQQRRIHTSPKILQCEQHWKCKLKKKYLYVKEDKKKV
jgi:hypothetical protein